VRAVVAKLTLLLLLLSSVAIAAPDPDLILSQTERVWLTQHPELVLAPAEDFAPYEFFDDKGRYRGMAADYIALLEKRLGIHFRTIRLSNEAARKQALASGRIDIVTAVTTDSLLAGEAQLARPHITIPGVIVAKSDYRNLHALQGLRVAQVNGAPLHINAGAIPGDMALVPVQDVTTALELISEGQIDALVTLGLPPMEYLVLPRVLALLLMMPLLVIYADAIGIAGGLLASVNLSNIGAQQFLLQISAAVDLNDIAVGIFKGGVFGLLVASAGCYHGMRSGRSSASVGRATTAAVVMSVVSIVVADALVTVVTTLTGI